MNANILRDLMPPNILVLTANVLVIDATTFVF